MTEQGSSNRHMVVVGAILIQLALGAIYAWPVFTPALEEAGWTKIETQIVFGVGLGSFAVFMVIAGRLLPRLGPRKLAMSGGVLLGLGYLLGGLFGGTNVVLLTLLLGLIGGAGIGFAYVVPIAVGMRWFPDKKGLITGLAVAGFGFGAMVWVKLAGSWGGLLQSIGLSTTFVVYGVLFCIAVLIGSIWMVFPPEDWKPPTPAPTAAAATAQAKKPPVAVVNLTSSEMLKKPQFYMIFVVFVFTAGAGLMTIGLMKMFPREALQAGGYGLDEADAIAGTAMAVFFALANGLGRIAWGALSDKLGRKRSLVIMCATQGVFVLAFVPMAAHHLTLYLAATLIGFNYGGIFALFPTVTADTFGSKHIGQLYGWVFLAYGVGGLAGPMLGGRLGDMGNFPLAFTICGVLCLVAAGISAALRPPVPHKRDTSLDSSLSQA